jgi:hypothetical protein
MIILEYLIVIGIVSFIWAFACMVLNVIYMMFNIGRINIKLPKDKKYDGKVDPIYEVKQDSYDDYYSVHKWELGYEEAEGLTMLSIVTIPLPVMVYRYGYNHVNSYKICELGEIYNITPVYMIDFFEQKWEEQLKETEEWKLRRNKKENHLDILNKTFNENYE